MATTPQARSGGGPGAGFLAATRRSHGGRISRALQMPEELPNHLAVRDGGEEPQRPLLIVRAARSRAAARRDTRLRVAGAMTSTDSSMLR